MFYQKEGGVAPNFGNVSLGLVGFLAKISPNSKKSLVNFKKDLKNQRKKSLKKLK